MLIADDSKMTWQQIHEVMANNPVDTAPYQHARSERNFRLGKYSLFICIGLGAATIAARLFWK